MAFHGWSAGVFERGLVRVQTGQEGETPEQICREAHRHRGESPSTSSEPGELGAARAWIQGRAPVPCSVCPTPGFSRPVRNSFSGWLCPSPQDPKARQTGRQGTSLSPSLLEVTLFPPRAGKPSFLLSLFVSSHRYKLVPVSVSL